MSKRVPTEEEILLWQQINGSTKKLAEGDVDVSPEAETCEPNVPPPVGGRLGGGHSGGIDSARLGPHPVKRFAGSFDPPRGEGVKVPHTHLDRRTAKKRSKPLPPLQATLDLHGCTQHQAHALVQQFVQQQRAQGSRHIAIITGKGRGSSEGVLRRAVPDWLNEPPLRAQVSGFFHAEEREGGTGVLHVLLKR